MKCKSCNFNNPDSQTRCTNCNAMLLSTTDSGLTTSGQETNIPVVPYLRRPPRPDSEDELARVKAKLTKIRSGKQNPPPPAQAQQTTISFEDRVLEVEMELNLLIKNYRSTLKPRHAKSPSTESQNINSKIEDLYTDLLNELPKTEDEFEINPIANFSDEKHKLVKDLYELQLKEFEKPRGDNSKSQVNQPSHARTLDGNNLQGTFHKLRRDLLQSVDSEKNHTNSETDYTIPTPDSKIIIYAFLTDIVLNIFISVASLLTYQANTRSEKSILEFSKSTFSENPYFLFTPKFVASFFASYFLVTLVLLLIKQGSLGQHLMGLQISNENGGRASRTRLLTRYIGLILNFLTFGIRPIVLLKKRNGMLCGISNTRISYSAFVE